MKSIILSLLAINFTTVETEETAAQTKCSTNERSKGEVPEPQDTIPLERLQTLVSHDASAAFPKDWVTTPQTLVVVRRDDPDGPTYQESIGYTFLIHSMKRPRLVRMDSGRLVIVATAWLYRNNEEIPIILHSDDDGKTWSPPREIPIHGTLVNLGGRKLMVLGTQIMFSEDAGETWSKPQPLRLPGGSLSEQPNKGSIPVYHHGSLLVENRNVYAIFYYEASPFGPTGWTARSFLWISQNSGHTWDKPIALPEEWNTSEGAITRAKDGALVVALRTAQAPGLPSYSDHWRRITTARSIDDGHTWKNKHVYFKYGKTP